MNPTQYSNFSNYSYQYQPKDYESDSEASEEHFKDVEIYETEFLSDPESDDENSPNPPPNSPTQSIPIPEKGKSDVENWNIVFFGD